jgi:hypothetical protein
MEAIDKVLRDFGMPVGPIELLDDVGIDVATKGGETLSAAWPERMPLDAAFAKLAASGRLGRKAGKGFYLYQGDKRTGPDASVYSELGIPAPSGLKGSVAELEARLLLPMVNEAAFCLAEASRRRRSWTAMMRHRLPPVRGGSPPTPTPRHRERRFGSRAPRGAAQARFRPALVEMAAREDLQLRIAKEHPMASDNAAGTTVENESFLRLSTWATSRTTCSFRSSPLRT